MQIENTQPDIISAIDFTSTEQVESVLTNYRLIESLSRSNLNVLELKLEIELIFNRIPQIDFKAFLESVDDMDMAVIQNVALIVTQYYCN